MRRARTSTALALPAAAVLAAAGCGAEVAPAEEGAAVTVSNCGEEIEYRTPERPVAYDMSATEKMFALGLADRMRGIVMPATTEPSVERSPYKEDYESVEVLGTDVISREIVVEARADWVLAGWNSGFSEERGITPELLDQVGIQSYMFTESCFDYGDDPVDVEPVEALYTDLRDIGAIFGVQDRAEALIADMEERFAALEEEVPEERAPVFVYDSGTDEPFTSGGQAAPSAIIDAAGGENVFADLNERWTTVGWESVIEAEPEVIVIIDYGDRPAEEKIDFLLSNERLASVPAIEEERFHVIDYAEAVSAPRNIDAAEGLAGYLRSIGR
ncbi:ABC transporter substrate-binding protein [Nocardiopsis sp. CNT-189]|uniref:ABC transporter substrate-binding protein n=1 Tax=Nocardiopsis oceanisediminis TaxID=2816862 RepID=UPI003B39C43F